jgi:uncharacterized membrane protein
MDVLMIVLRITHIFSGVFWVGVSFFNIFFLQPTVQSTGSDGQKVMQYLTTKTRFTVTVYTAATLSLLSGLIMYWKLYGFRPSVLRTSNGLVLTIGAIAGIIAWIIAIVFIRRIIGRMQATGKAVQEQGGPPTPEQAAVLQSSSRQLVQLGQWGLVFMVIALTGMSIARYFVI